MFQLNLQFGSLEELQPSQTVVYEIFRIFTECEEWATF